MKPPTGTPCRECPMRRASAPGWLGSDTPEDFIRTMHGDMPMPCHLAVNYEDPYWRQRLKDAPQCSGQAIYLSNICKRPRPDLQGNPVAQTLPADRVTVFARPDEFLAHHTGPLAPPRPAKKKPRRERSVTKKSP